MAIREIKTFEKKGITQSEITIEPAKRERPKFGQVATVICSKESEEVVQIDDSSSAVVFLI